VEALDVNGGGAAPGLLDVRWEVYMHRNDELPRQRDEDGDRIPDDADTAEAIRDVADTFRTDDVGKDIGPAGVGATPDDEDDK
jgi:hypothetical protein